MIGCRDWSWTSLLMMVSSSGSEEMGRSIRSIWKPQRRQTTLRAHMLLHLRLKKVGKIFLRSQAVSWSHAFAFIIMQQCISAMSTNFRLEPFCLAGIQLEYPSLRLFQDSSYKCSYSVSSKVNVAQCSLLRAYLLRDAYNFTLRQDISLSCAECLGQYNGIVHNVL